MSLFCIVYFNLVMCDLLKKLNYESELTYRRCGEIVVAPKRNIFALYCNLCNDVFMRMQEFVRHARREHDDEYEFEISKEDNVDVYDIEEITGGMTLDEIDAAERAEWLRRKKSIHMDKEKLEATNFEDYLLVAKVSKQDNVLTEQKSVTLTEKTLEAAATDRKASIKELETLEGNNIILGIENLNSHDEDSSEYKSSKKIVQDDIIQVQVDVFENLAADKPLQFSDGFSDTNISNTEDSLISEENMNSLVLRSINIKNLTKSTTETLIPAEKQNSLVLSSDDLANTLKNKKESRTSEENHNDLSDLQKAKNVLSISEENVVNCLTLENHDDLSDLQIAKNVLSISEDNVNCLTLKNHDQTDFKKTTNMISTTQEETNSLVLETPDLEALPRNKSECVISDENIVFTDEPSALEKNSNALADLQEIPKKSSILEECMKSLPLENLDTVDMQKSSKEPSFSKEITDSLKLVDPELVDLLTEFDIDLDSFDMKIFDKLTSPKKTMSNDKENSFHPLQQGIGLNSMVEDADMPRKGGGEIITANIPKVSKKRGRPRKENKYLLEGNQNNSKSTELQHSTLNSNAIKLPTLKVQKNNLKKRSFRVKSASCLNPNKNSSNKNNLKNVSNSKSKANETSVENDINIKLNNSLKMLTLDQNNENLNIKNVCKANSPVKPYFKNLNDSIKKINKSPNKNSRNHSTERASSNKTPVPTQTPTKNLLSPDEAKFHQSLKVRIKKLSPAPKKDVSNNDCKLKALDLNSKIPEKRNNPHLFKSTVDVSQTLQNLSVEPATPVKNTYCKQNLTAQILKDINMKNSAEDIKNLGDIGGTQFHSSASIKKMIRTKKASIDVLLNIETSLNKNNNIRNNIISRKIHKNLLIQRMAQIRKRITQVLDDGKVKTEANLIDTKIFDVENVKYTNNLSDNCKDNSRKIEIQNVIMLQPHSSTKIEPLPSFDVFKNPLVKLEIATKVKDESQLVSDTSTTQITNSKSLLNQSLKSKKKTSKNTPKHSKFADLEASKVYLSDSVVSSVQNDYSQNKLDVPQIDILQQDVSETNENIRKQSKKKSASIVGELLYQVAYEKHENKRTATELKDKSKDAIKKSIDYEMQLLDNVGLNFIKKSSTETLTLDQEEEMYSKAKKLADILKNNSLVWNIKDAKHKIAKERELSFNLIKQAVNAALAVNLTLTDIKRVCNLIMSWYTNQNNSKLIDKKEVPKSLKKFVELFIFISKTGRPIYNCEFCDDQFRSEHLYGLHRCTHTGGAPYNCAYCGKAFSRSASFKAHESKHVEIINMQLQQPQTTVYSPLGKYNVQRRSKLKCDHSPEKSAIENYAKRHKIDQTTKECDLCYEKFKTAKELYAHKITHLKCVYKCKVCKKVLTSLTDMQTHVKTFHK